MKPVTSKETLPAEGQPWDVFPGCPGGSDDLRHWSLRCRMPARGPRRRPQSGNAAVTAHGPVPAVHAAVETALPAAVPADDKPDPKLVEQGKARYQAYRCFDCHGKNGEGTDDAPDLIGTHLDADGIAKFLAKPSADAQAKGMPTIAVDSPDSKPLVAFVLSIKKAK